MSRFLAGQGFDRAGGQGHVKMNPSDFILATDLDGTLKKKGEQLSGAVLQELQRLKSLGMKLVIVTGRCMQELGEVVDLALFDAAVAENGAVISAGGNDIIIVPNGWWSLRRSLVDRFGSGCERVIISLPRGTIIDLDDLEGVKVEYNKDRVMLLPEGVSKKMGLMKAVEYLRLQNRKIIAVGDGENDASLLSCGDLKIALKNSVAELKLMADIIADEEDGEGFLHVMQKLFPESNL